MFSNSATVLILISPLLVSIEPAERFKFLDLIVFETSAKDSSYSASLSKLTLISNVYNYGKAEDCNHIFMHSLMQFLINKHKIRKKIRI